ncbi:MAG: outer membrane beta-barrel protein [Cyclobacteriaceae bacterium]|nr:outer membrane beta-barrel protein [Cyclobacteriaceae bacterium]
MSVLAISWFAFPPVLAQIEKGYNLVGGSASIGLNTDRFSIYIGPDLGCFVRDRLAVGASLPIYFSDSEFSTTFSISVMPFIRYYFGESKTKFFVHGGLGIGSSSYTYTANGGKEKDTDFEFNSDLRAGIAHFITDQVALEAVLRYQSFDIFDDYFGSFGIAVGLQIHIFRLFKGGGDTD